MGLWRYVFACSFLSLNFSYFVPVADAQSMVNIASAVVGEPQANTVALPGQILKTKINIFAKNLSPNTLQMADNLKLTPVLEHIAELRAQVKEISGPITLENLALRQELTESLLQADQIIATASLSIDFTLAEIDAEENIYSEILATYENSRDKTVARTNAASFYTNGALWAVAEALDIPTYKYPRFSISSGINGILAGIVPSIASLYAMHQYNGKRCLSDSDPNMLAKLFGYPINSEIEYPKPVWDFLNTAPAGDTNDKARKDQLIDRWITDKNITAFTNRQSKEQLDVITASVAHQKGLTIDTLMVRQAMLRQLAAEIMKMKRMLLELTMVVQGEKHL